MIELGDGAPRYVRRLDGEKMKPVLCNQKVKFPTKVMIWGGISVKGVTPIYVVDGIMNSNKYKDVLEEVVVPSMKKWFRRSGVFVQDGAPCHTSKLCMEFLKNKRINVLDWPGNSPDCNPIENIWAILKEKVHKRSPKSKSELISTIKDIWENDAELHQSIINAIRSMPKRINLVIKARGGHIRY